MNPYYIIAKLVLLLVAIPVGMWLIYILLGEFAKSNARLNDMFDKTEEEQKHVRVL